MVSVDVKHHVYLLLGRVAVCCLEGRLTDSRSKHIKVVKLKEHYLLAQNTTSSVAKTYVTGKGTTSCDQSPPVYNVAARIPVLAFKSPHIIMLLVSGCY